MTLFTGIHVLISLVAILAGFVVVFGMIGGKPLPSWTALFFWTTVATSVTGFMFPVQHFMPSHAVGILSLLVLTLTFLGRYVFKLSGAWRKTYAITAVIALYFNVFVLVVQLFLKVPALHALAPNGNEPPFGIAQGTVLVVFVALGIAAAKRFRATQPPIYP
jgi:uncharacterized membrane protein YozB (DUF420 family)